VADQNGRNRLDRIEAILLRVVETQDRMQLDLKQLLTAQVVLTDRVDRLAQSVADLADAQKHTEERLNALIAVVDDIVRKRPPA
jgi:DNA invertase Pin-like site-specific DNA recombinase